MTQNIKCIFWPGHCVPDIQGICYECNEPADDPPRTWGTAPRGALSLAPEGYGDVSLIPEGES